MIVLRGGLHGRPQLSRTGTAQRLDVSSGRIQSAERSGLAGLRNADARSGCGLGSNAGRDALGRRLADGTIPELSPVSVAGRPPALVPTHSLAKRRGKVLAAQASVSSDAEVTKTPLRAGLASTPGDGGSVLSAPAWAAMLGALGLAAGAGLVLLRRRRMADPYRYYQLPPWVDPSKAGPDPVNRSEAVAPQAPPPVAPAPAPWDEPAGENGALGEGEQEEDNGPDYSFFGIAGTQQDGQPRPGPLPPRPDAESPARPAPRRGRLASVLGPFVTSGLIVTVLLGRLIGRQRRR